MSYFKLQADVRTTTKIMHNNITFNRDNKNIINASLKKVIPIRLEDATICTNPMQPIFPPISSLDYILWLPLISAQTNVAVPQTYEPGANASSTFIGLYRHRFWSAVMVKIHVISFVSLSLKIICDKFGEDWAMFVYAVLKKLTYFLFSVRQSCI